MKIKFEKVADQHCLVIGDEKCIIDSLDELVKIKDSLIRYLDKVYVEENN